MNLGTVEEAVARLKESGYSNKAIDVLQTNPWGKAERLEFSDPIRLGDRVLNMEWQLKIDQQGQVTAPPLTASLLYVPIRHATVLDIDSRELEKRMQGINWNEPSLNDLGVRAIFADLNQLSRSNDPKGEEIADRLALKYWSWQAPGEGNLYLEEKKQDFMVSKTYHDLPRFTRAYNDLTDLMKAKIKQQELTPMAREPEAQYHTLKPNAMNRNNLENLKEEMTALGVKPKLIAQMEKNMENNMPQFTLHDSIPGNKGIVNVAIPFKQSGQSEHYYLNKYQVSLDKGGKALEDGQKYMVIARGEENKFRSFQDPHEAIAYFKEKKGNGELAIGKDLKNKTMLATMENDKVNYVVKDFQRTFNNPAVTQTFYVENGKGFSVDQAANLIQGRAVYRDDLANAAGMSYKAWVVLDLNNAKDRHGNFLSKHYHDPSYGFDLNKVLDNFNIKELSDPAKREKLEESIRQGNRPLVTVTKDGEEMKVHLEAAPRFSQLNMYQENGKPEKREQFLKPELNQTQQIGKGREQAKEQQQEHGMSV